MMQKKLNDLIVAVLLATALFFQGAAHAQVILGQSCAISGPTSFLGLEMNRGAKAYFDKNDSEITLKLLDDKYEPAKCIENTNKFLKNGVTALFGYVGTPTSKAAVPLAMAKKTIFFGAFTGADFLSNHAVSPYAFSFRASYDAEIENMVKHLKEDLGITKIALFVQRDAFGLAGVKGTVKAVEKIGNMEIIPRVPDIPKPRALKQKWDAFWNAVPNYKRNTIAVGRDARKISGNKNIEAVILVGAYRPCAAAINLWKKLNFDAVFINISFVGSKRLAETLEDNVKNVFISQVVPDPWNSGIPIIREYQEAMGDNYGFVSLEGYIAAKIIHKAIADAGDSVSSESLRKKLEAMAGYDVGGMKISFGPGDHRGSDSVYMTQIENPGKKSFRIKYVSKLTKE
ncbi:ABC transporter substrate-binding protein [Desulfonema magnum]|uniref:Leucine-binding domain-containing protein n=1 Tax=Desulfonema magnum TaxID=45655 RepID=A0A975BI01_9BACT|nr:ABC transporter substrate-binding protein [Desulfonema magnum]QTA85757.1 Leucine-binding domain-containing protein [Desulfonema magnum]